MIHEKIATVGKTERMETHFVWGDMSLPEPSLPSLSLGQDMITA